MTAVNGIVTYTNLTHFNATTMNLQFTAGSFSTTSTPVTVTAGPATRSRIYSATRWSKQAMCSTRNRLSQ